MLNLYISSWLNIKSRAAAIPPIPKAADGGHKPDRKNAE